jgi:predicted RNase H-like HicB family nuclease
MKSYVFSVVVEEDAFPDGRKAFHGYCPALKGCHTWGHTYDETMANLREAIELYVEEIRESGSTLSTNPELGVLSLPSPSIAVNL